MDSNQIEQAFLETNYIAEIENNPIVLKIGQTPKNLIQRLLKLKLGHLLLLGTPFQIY